MRSVAALSFLCCECMKRVAVKMALPTVAGLHERSKELLIPLL